MTGNLLHIFQLPTIYHKYFAYGTAVELTALLLSLSILIFFCFSGMKDICLLTVFGTLANAFHLAVGIPVLLILLSQIPELMQEKWLKEQPGYPEFNERFDEQMENFGKEYQSDYAFHSAITEMPELPELSSLDMFIKEQTETFEMPAIPEISELQKESDIDEKKI